MNFKRNVLSIAVLMTSSAWAADTAQTETKRLNPVVVSASLIEQDATTSPAFTTVITAEDIAKSPVNGLADLLRETVGVNNSTDNTGRDELQIRGLGGRYTLILVDGKRISSSGALWRGGDFDYSSVPLGSIERVEIVRGPMAALYGSDAIGGVINIITKQPGKDWTGTVTAEYRGIDAGDEGDQRRLNASASGALSDTVSLAISGEVYDRDPWYVTSSDDITHPARLEEKQAKNLVTTTSIQLSKTQKLDVDVSYNHDERPRALYRYAYYPDWDYTAIDFREQEITRKSYGLTHTGQWEWGTSTAFVKQEDAEIKDFNTAYNAPQQRTLNEKNTYAKIYGNAELGINNLTGGLDYRDQTIEDAATYLETGEVATNNIALFVQDEISLAEKFKLTLGGRTDDHEVFGNHFTPKVYFTYLANTDLTFKGGVSEAFKAPDPYQLSEQYRVISCGGNCYLAGNPDLKPETSTNYEVGFELHKKDWNFSAVAFKNDVEDMIIAYYNSALLSREWVNVATAKTSGIELQGSVTINTAFSVSGNFTHLKADYTDGDGKETTLDNRPENLANITLNWKPSQRIQTSLSAHYTGEQYYEAKALPSYTRVDFAVSADFTKNLVGRVGIKNLTDVNLDEKSENFVSSELRRNYYASLSYQF